VHQLVFGPGALERLREGQVGHLGTQSLCQDLLDSFLKRGQKGTSGAGGNVPS
jgi:hypothetical protein